MAASSVSTPMGRPSPESTARLRPRFGDRLVLRQANFRELADGRARRPASAPSTAACSTSACRASSWPTRDRGFGFRAGGPLDMRFDTSRGVPAAELLATLDAAELTALFRRYGEEPKAPPHRPGHRRRPADRADRDRRGARRARRAGRRRRTRAEPAPDPSRRPASSRRCGSPSTRSSTPSQAGLAAALDLLRPGGRLVVLSYHSLEDRIVKRFIAGRAARLRLPARGAGLRLRPEPAAAARDPAVADPDGRRDRRQPPRPERPAAGRRAARRLSRSPAEPPRTGPEEGGAPDEQAPPVQPSQDLRPPPARGARAARIAASTPRASSSSSATWGSAGQADPLALPRPAQRRASASRSATDRWPSTRAPARAPSRSPRPPARSPRAPTLGRAARRAAPSAPAAGRTGSGSSSAAIVVAFLLAFFSLAQQVRVSATGLDIGRLAARARSASTTPRPGPPLRPQPARPRAGDPQAGHRRRPRPARRAARPAGPLGDRPTDAGPDRFAPPPARPAASSSWSARCALVARLAYWQVVERDRLAAEARRPDDGHASRRRASAATSTTGPGRSSSPRRSSASASSPRPTS